MNAITIFQFWTREDCRYESQVQVSASLRCLSAVVMNATQQEIEKVKCYELSRLYGKSCVRAQ